MAKPVVIAKKPAGHEFVVRYVVEGETHIVSVYEDTLENALAEAREALTQAFKADYTLLGIEMVR